MSITDDELQFVKPLFYDAKGFAAMCSLHAMGSNVTLAELARDETLRNFIGSDKIQEFLQARIESAVYDQDDQTTNQQLVDDIVAAFKKDPHGLMAAIDEAPVDGLVSVLAHYTDNQTLRAMLYDTASFQWEDDESLAELTLSQDEIDEAAERDNPVAITSDQTPPSLEEASPITGESEPVAQPLQCTQDLLTAFEQHYQSDLNTALEIAQDPSEFDELMQQWAWQRVFAQCFLQALAQDDHFDFKLLGRYGDNSHGFSDYVSYFAAVVLYSQHTQNPSAFVVNLVNPEAIGLASCDEQSGRLMQRDQEEEFVAPLSNMGTIFFLPPSGVTSEAPDTVKLEQLLGFVPGETIDQSDTRKVQSLVNSALLRASKLAQRLFEDKVAHSISDSRREDPSATTSANAFCLANVYGISIGGEAMELKTMKPSATDAPAP